MVNPDEMSEKERVFELWRLLRRIDRYLEARQRPEIQADLSSKNNWAARMRCEFAESLRPWLQWTYKKPRR